MRIQLPNVVFNSQRKIPKLFRTAPEQVRAELSELQEQLTNAREENAALETETIELCQQAPAAHSILTSLKAGESLRHSIRQHFGSTVVRVR